jgi:beta-lactamase class A
MNPLIQIQQRINKTSLLVLVMFVAGWTGHVIYSADSGSSYVNISQIREDSAAYQYTNPLLYIENSDLEFKELNPLKEKVQDYLDDQIISGRVTAASYYFRDLNTGAWTGVRPDDKYVPASMLKVAVLMTYLRLAEDDPTIFDQSLYYKKNPNDRQNYPPSNKIEDGYYRINELLGQAIIESDNAASVALSLPVENEIASLYAALRFPPLPKKLVDFLSPKDVSKIFRSLYSSTYLLNSYSEQALKLLTQTKFNNGLVRGVKEGVVVSHKFGEHTTYYTDHTEPDFQLHDCGIVYYPRRPYFICVMTKGKALADLEDTIAKSSKLTYSFVDN